MKRTSLTRRAPLKARTGLRRGSPLKVVTALRRSRPTPPVKIGGLSASEIWREGLGPCVVCPFEGGTCSGPVQGHHICHEQTLKRRGVSFLVLLDHRNRLPVCKHRHEQHTNGYRPIPRAVLPPAVFEFADELGLGWWIDKHYPEQKPVAA